MPADQIYRTCPNEECSNSGTYFDIDEENVYCTKCGNKLVEVEEEPE